MTGLAATRAGEMFSLAGRTAMVTGASSGLGRRFAAVLAARGASVVIGARRTGALADLAGEIEAAGGRALATALDVTEPASVEAAFAAGAEAFGPIEVVVNNAGLSVFGTVTSGDPAHWRAVMDVNLDGAYRVLRQAARALRAAGRGGSIVNIASFLGIEVQPGQAAYQASKAGVIQLTRTAARELARHNIRVNAIAPGFFASEMTDGFLATDSGRHMVRQLPQRRAGAPAELDGALLLLASDAGRYMTGSVLTVDGGHGLCMP